MKRVAHLIPSIGVGGTEQMVLELCRHRDRSAFECLVATFVAGGVAAEIQETGTPVLAGPTAFQAVTGAADLIIAHWWAEDDAMLAWLQAQGTPFLLTLHGPIPLPPIGAPVICTSEYVYQLQEHPEQCVVIPNGVDLSRFTLPRPEPRPEVILTRICRPPRCASYFWPAVKQVLDRYPQTRLWIIGAEGEGGWISDRVRFWGVRRDIPALLAETDIFVYTPYPRAGSMDLSPLEAAAAGVPCVLSDVPAVRPAVQHGATGFLVPFGDVGEYVNKVGLLTADRALRERMGREARRIAEERFDIRPVVQRHEAVYRAVLDRNTSHQPRVSGIGPPSARERNPIDVRTR